MSTRPDLAARNRARATHAMSKSSTYAVWQSMHARCSRPSAKDYARYGGRGIAVCERWNSFHNFLADMGERPAGLTLDRRDGEKNYEPGNCRWATPTQQARNRSSNVLLTHDGVTATVAEWAERSGLERQTLAWRVRAGWDAARAINTPSTIDRKQRT